MAPRSQSLFPLALLLGFLTFLAQNTLAEEQVAEKPAAESNANSERPLLWGLELGVPDVERAVAFYRQALGFELTTLDASGAWAELTNGPARLTLALSSVPPAAFGAARAYSNFSVGNLDIAATAIRQAGGSVDDRVNETPVGSSLHIRDPFGNPANLIDHPWDDRTADSSPAVFNFGVSVSDIPATEAFYTALGFTVSTRKYLPRTLVFKTQGVAQIILHRSAVAEGAEGGVGALLVDGEPAAALNALADAADVRRTTPAAMPGRGLTLELRDPSGIPVKVAHREIREAEEISSQLSAADAKASFERLKSLAGHWQAKSTRGWDEPITYEIGAKGSIVVERNAFKDAPANTMYTMFHLDGERLLATHYCEAGNQPRLQATAIADHGRTLTFTYLDGTGLPSREHGHMDQAVFRFLDDDRFTAKWTWYEKGHEQWLEEIEHRRVVSPQPQATR